MELVALLEEAQELRVDLREVGAVGRRHLELSLQARAGGEDLAEGAEEGRDAGGLRAPELQALARRKERQQQPGRTSGRC